MSTFALVVFDLDGTLIDSRLDLANSANEMLAAFNAPALPVDTVTAMVGEGARLLVQRACDAAGLGPVPADALGRFLAIYGRRLFDHTRPYDGVPEMLEALAPRARLAILTNKPQPFAERLAEGFGFAAWIADLIGGDGGYPRKPAPDGLLALVERAGTRPERTLMVGDSWIDLDTARQAGARMCLARYGFGWERLSPDRLAGDELAIDTPLALVPLVVG